ncbi:MAG TPA: endonuclease III [Acholeplasma sp.]|nr:endonuclease III [Acholeplasma sp.]
MDSKIKYILEQLDILFPDAKGELDHSNNFELLIAVVLSAQTTDAAVNIVTKDLFSHYPTPNDLANAKLEDVMKLINRIGLYRNKSKNIIELSKILVEKYNGEVPNTREALESLPGVGRKTANVVLSIAFNVPAIAVDTHVARVSKRLGLVDEDDSVLEIEHKLMNLFPKDKWIKLHHQLILYGRYYCPARKSKENKCVFKEFCSFCKEI